MLGRILVGLIIMGVGVAVIMYAAQLVDIFDQGPEYINYFRMAGMVAIVVGVLFMFGIVGSGGTENITLGGAT